MSLVTQSTAGRLRRTWRRNPAYRTGRHCKWRWHVEREVTRTVEIWRARRERLAPLEEDVAAAPILGEAAQALADLVEIQRPAPPGAEGSGSGCPYIAKADLRLAWRLVRRLERLWSTIRAWWWHWWDRRRAQLRALSRAWREEPMNQRARPVRVHRPAQSPQRPPIPTSSPPPPPVYAPASVSERQAHVQAMLRDLLGRIGADGRSRGGLVRAAS